MPVLLKKIDFCRMDIRPVFFKEIDFMISLKNRLDSASVRCLRFGKGKSRKQIFPSQSRPNIHFAEARQRRRWHGYITAELLTATALLGLMITGLAVSMNGFSKFNQYQWTRQRCMAAAQAQLDSITATGRSIEPQELKRLWPGVEVVVQTKPGEAPWDGLTALGVTATGQVGSRQVSVHLARYVLVHY